MTDPPPGALTGIIDRVLHFMDRPWKAVVVVMLILILGAGWFAWDKRDELFEAWMTPDAPELKTVDIPDALTKLASETNADLVQIWAVDLSANAQWFVAARRHDEQRPVIPSPRRLPIIDQTSDVRRLVDVLEGHPVCVDLHALGTPVARRLAERGMKRGCAIPIPPDPSAFVGVVYISWATPPDQSAENVAVGAAREIAGRLATH